MINLISSGDLDYGRIKRYLCDSIEDFAELPVVAEGSTVLVQSTGEYYMIDADGNWNLQGSIGGGEGGTPIPGPPGEPGKDGEDGEDGHTPIKGVDYWTEEDKAAIIEDLIASKPIKPVYDSELKALFCNGVGIIVSDSGGDNVITYYLDIDTTEMIHIPYGVRIYGGGNSLEMPLNFAASSIIMNSGNIADIIGGGLGGCSVGTSSIVVNGGTVSGVIAGGGVNNKPTNDATGNIVGQALITINSFEGNASAIYGGGASGMARVGDIVMNINGGQASFLVGAGSNGYCGSVEMNINGGEFNVVQPTGNGHVGSAKINMNKGSVNKMYCGGPANTICGKTIMNIKGGSITKLGQGSSNDNTINHISGEYITGVIANEEIAPTLNLVRVPTLEETIKRIIALESTVTIADIGE